MPLCLIGLGANLGNRARSLNAAVELLAHQDGIRLVAKSRWHETAPVGGPADQPPFLNGAVTLETSLAPETLLDVLQQIERVLGRARGRRWGPRTIDLDLLLVEDTILSTPRLVLPHPRMAWRQFVLVPACEVAPDMVHPTTGWTLKRLLDHANTARPYVAIAGGIGSGKTALVERLARSGSVRAVLEPLDSARLGAFYADPSGHAWAMELEFLDQRARLLAAAGTTWSEEQPAVSDFWFDQSCAFARVWLPPERLEAFQTRFEETRQGVVHPKLLVLLDVPVPRLLGRIRRRGRPFERDLDAGLLERIARSIAEAAGAPDVGPMLRLSDPSPSDALREVSAALEAMKGPTAQNS